MMSGHLTGTQTHTDMSLLVFIISVMFATALTAFGDLSTTDLGLCSRSTGSHYPDAVQSSSGPAGNNMVSALKFDHYKKRKRHL